MADKPWAVKFLESLDPKWIASLFVALIGVGGFAHNAVRINEESKLAYQNETKLASRVDSLASVLAKTRRELAALKHLRRTESTYTPTEPETKPGVARRVLSAIFSPFRRG